MDRFQQQVLDINYPFADNDAFIVSLINVRIYITIVLLHQYQLCLIHSSSLFTSCNLFELSNCSKIWNAFLIFVDFIYCFKMKIITIKMINITTIWELFSIGGITYKLYPYWQQYFYCTTHHNTKRCIFHWLFIN